MKYRKKPIVIEAAFFDGDLVGEPDGNGKVVPRTCPAWFPAVLRETHPDNTWARPGEVFSAGDKICIGTMEGTLIASPGDWIIRGVKDDIYPVKPDLFAATYESAE